MSTPPTPAATNYILCNEYKNCGQTDCPSYNNREQPDCWKMPLTWCKDPITHQNRPKTLEEKQTLCYQGCKYFQGRVKIRLGNFDSLKEEGLEGILKVPVAQAKGPAKK